MAISKTLSIAAFALLANAPILSQTLPDTLLVSASVENAKQVYYQTPGSNANLYNGKEYVPFKKNMPEIGTPYFHSEEWEVGSIFYDGQLYEQVSLRYDLLHGKVVVEHRGQGEIELIDEKILYFIIAGHRFQWLEEKSENRSILTPGFYDIIYDGTSKVLVKRLKVTQERVETQTSMILTFKEKNSLLIFNRGNYYQAGNKSSVLRIFADQKPALKKFISKNRIRYRNNREEALVKIAAHYDQLKE